MAYETSALRGDPQHESVAEDDYQSFSEALNASARGRAFLAEYARRNRHADTAVVLAALDRLEAVARSQKAAPEAERIRQDLRALLDTLQSAKPQIDLSPGAIKAATLSALLEFVQARIEALVGPAAAPGVRAFLAPVPQSDEPELPIPRPGPSAQPSIALVQTITPPVEDIPAPGSAKDPLVLSLDPRVGPVFGEPTADAPRPPNVIPQIDFVGPLFEPAEAKAAPVATTEEPVTLTLAPPAAAASDEIAVAPPPSAAVLPPLELTSPALIAPDAIADAETTARADALVRATNATADAIDNIVAAAAALMAEATAAEAATAISAAAETATAALPAAEAAIADVAPVETAAADMAAVDMAAVDMTIVETPVAEAIIAEIAVVETIAAETPVAEIVFSDATPDETAPGDANLPEIGFVAAGAADVELTQSPAAKTAAAATFEPLTFPTEIQTPNVAAAAPELAGAAPAKPVRDDALAAIMAMSEEERLALFT